jgi:hypothetical protein
MAAGLNADDYLTKAGQLTQELKVVQLQGGFAGFTGVQYTIARDGVWTSVSVFNKKTTPKDKGKLTAKELEKLAALLDKYDLAKLPAKAGKQPGANPHTIAFEYGKQKASLVGQTPPKLDKENPAGTVESRFAGIYQGVVELLAPAKDKKSADR